MYVDRYQHLEQLSRIRIPDHPGDGTELRLDRNEKPEPWPDGLLELVFNSMPANILQRYPDLEGFYAQLSEFLEVPKNRILVTSGIDEAIRLIMNLSCESGDGFAVPWPGYAMYDVYGQIFRLNQTKIIYSPTQFTTPDKLCDQLPDNTKVLFLPNPNQPVENCFAVEQLEHIIAYCRDREILTAVDEAYYFFGGPSAIDLTEQYDNLLVMRSFSKAFGAAGLRLGYMVGSNKALGPLAAFRLAYEMNAITAHAGSVLLDSFHTHIEPSVNDICAGRDFLRDKVIDHGLKAWGTVSNNVLIDLGSNERVAAVVSRLKLSGIHVKGQFSEPMDKFILVTCGPQAMMVKFFDAFIETLEDW